MFGAELPREVRRRDLRHMGDVSDAEDAGQIGMDESANPGHPDRDAEAMLWRSMAGAVSRARHVSLQWLPAGLGPIGPELIRAFWLAPGGRLSDRGDARPCRTRATSVRLRCVSTRYPGASARRTIEELCASQAVPASSATASRTDASGGLALGWLRFQGNRGCSTRSTCHFSSVMIGGTCCTHHCQTRDPVALRAS